MVCFVVDQPILILPSRDAKASNFFFCVASLYTSIVVLISAWPIISCTTLRLVSFSQNRVQNFWRHSPGLLSASLFSPREQEGWPYGVLLVPSVFLLSPYDPSYPFPQAIPNKPCLSRGIHWVVCEDFSRVLSVAPASEAPWLPCLSQGWGSGRGTAAPGFPRGLRCYSHLWPSEILG